MHLNRIALLFIFLFFRNLLVAQVNTFDFSYNVTIDLQNVTSEKDRVKVTILTPPIEATTIRYVLPAYLPGVAGKIDAGRFVHQFYALDNNGFPLSVSKKGDNVILMKMNAGAVLKKIEYWVDDTWDDEKTSASQTDARFNYVNQAAGSNINAGNNFVINHAFYFGYIEGFSDIPYTVNILKYEDLKVSSALRIFSESQTRDSYKAANYAELVDSPVMYSRLDTCGFLAGNIYISISVFSENGRISARLVRRLLAAQLSASANFISAIGKKKYELIFYFTTPFKTVLNQNGNYGGVAHKNSAFYFMPEMTDEDDLLNELLLKTSADMMHMLSPLDFQSFLGNENFLKPQLTKNWWFLEGVNTYFGWLADIRDSVVNESDFMGALSAKVKLLHMNSKKPISNLAFITDALNDPLNKEIIRARAVLTACLLDIHLTEISAGKIGLKEAVFELNRKSSLSSASLEELLVDIAGPSITDFFHAYVDGTVPLPLKNSFQKIAWNYNDKTIDSVYTFGPFGLIYNEIVDGFFVYHADTSNLFGMRDGDRILSVDGMVVNSVNFDEALMPVYTPDKSGVVELIYSRKNIAVTSRATPNIKTVMYEYIIRKDESANEKEQVLHNRIFAPAALQ